MGMHGRDVHSRGPGSKPVGARSCATDVARLRNVNTDAE